MKARKLAMHAQPVEATPMLQWGRADEGAETGPGTKDVELVL